MELTKKGLPMGWNNSRTLFWGIFTSIQLFSYAVSARNFSVTIEAHREDISYLEKKTEYKIVGNKKICKEQGLPRTAGDWRCMKAKEEIVRCARDFVCSHAGADYNRTSELKKLDQTLRRLPQNKDTFKVFVSKNSANQIVRSPLQDQFLGRSLSKRRPQERYVKKKKKKKEVLWDDEDSDEDQGQQEESSSLESRPAKSSVGQEKNDSSLGGEWWAFNLGASNINYNGGSLNTMHFGWSPRTWLTPALGGRIQLGGYMFELTVSTAIEETTETFFVFDLALLGAYRVGALFFELGPGYQAYQNDHSDSYVCLWAGGGYQFSDKLGPIDRIYAHYIKVFGDTDVYELRLGLGMVF